MRLTYLDDWPVNTKVEPIGDVAPKVDQADEALFLIERNKRLRGEPTKDRRPFHTLPLAQQCALRCRDERFQDFLFQTYDNRNALDLPPAELAAAMVRELCMVNSRSDLGKGNLECDNRWRELNVEFERWVTTQQYAGSINR